MPSDYYDDYGGTGLSYKSSDNPMYDAYYKANPYVGQKYNPTIWDDLFGGIFRTGYDKWRDEMALNAAQYDASIVDLEQQNIYNSDVAKVDRMRTAGENPDLLGTGDVSDSATPAQDPQDAQIPDALDMSQVASFAGMIGQCFSGAFAMAKQGIDLVGAWSNIEGQNITNAGNLQELALQTIRNRIPAEGFSTDADYLSWIEGLHESPDVKWSQSLAYSLGLKRSQRRSFDEAYRNAIGSLPAELSRFKDSNELAKEKLGYARTTSSEFYSDSIEVMKGTNKILVMSDDEFQKLIAKNKVHEQNIVSSELENRGTQADITGQYLDVLNNNDVGAKRGLNEVEGLDIQHQQNEIDKILKKTRKKLLDFYESEARKGNSFATYMIHNMMLKDFMNFEFKLNGDLGAGIGKVLPKTAQGWLPNFGLDISGEFGMH